MFLCKLKTHGIKAVCVFDGPNPPPEKQEEQSSRRDQSKKDIARMKRANEIRTSLINKYIPKDVPLPEALQDECKALVGKMKSPRPIAWIEPSEVYQIINEVISKLEKRTSPITDECREKAWEITYFSSER